MQRIVRLTWRHLGAAISLILFFAALWVLHHLLREVHLADVLKQFRATPFMSIVLAVAGAAGSYLTLTGYDVVALRYLKKPMPYSRAALASFVGYAFSHNIGLALLTGGSIRYRIYSAVGLSATEIATLTGFCGLTFGLGIAAVLGIALWLEPETLSSIDRLPVVWNRASGVLLLLIVAAYAIWAASGRHLLNVRGWSLPSPGPSVTVLQFALAGIDIVLAAGALYVLLPSENAVNFIAFVGIYAAAVAIGVASHAPGGLGVFEAVMLVALPQLDRAGMLGALIVYRCVYYLLPLVVATILLIWHEYQLHRHALTPAAQAVRSIAHAVVPALVGSLVFAGGAILLFSAATPMLHERLTLIRHIVPLPFVEASHLLSSVVGLWLMILARGLFRRLDGAFHLAVVVLCGGVIFSLLKGFDYEEALILASVLLILTVSRHAFYRKASLLRQPFSIAWLVTIATIIGGSIWLGEFAFKHVQYSGDLWWEFAYRGDAPRFLRASVTVVVVALGLAFYSALRPQTLGKNGAVPPCDIVKKLVRASSHTDANLALAGDKRILMAETEDAFIMYQVQGRSWIALGEPVGAKPAWEGLIWRYRELCDRYGGWPVFYQIGAESVPIFLDSGLTVLKLGEEARVDLRRFTLAGGAAKKLRYAMRRALREGATFEIVPADRVPAILPQLHAVSEEWLSAKAAREKHFSVGTFARDYFEQFDCAIVRRGGEILAFANIWQTAGREELSVDLMRHRQEVPYGIMDFLFISLMLWGKEQDYNWFNLGMAPLAGLDAHPLGHVWNRIGALVFRYGEHFYNFEGLRNYKAKFDPVWEPKYLAAPGGLAIPRILIDAATLIAGDAKSLFR